MAMHHSAVNTLLPRELLYTAVRSCKAPRRQDPYVFHIPCTHSGKSRSPLYTRCMTWNDCHCNPPLSGEHSSINGIFVHQLYGPVQHHGSGPGTPPTYLVHILGSPVAPCTLGIRLGTIIMVMHHSAVNTVPPTEFSYTRCTDLYS